MNRRRRRRESPARVRLSAGREPGPRHEVGLGVEALDALRLDEDTGLHVADRVLEHAAVRGQVHLHPLARKALLAAHEDHVAHRDDATALAARGNDALVEVQTVRLDAQLADLEVDEAFSPEVLQAAPLRLGREATELAGFGQGRRRRHLRRERGLRRLLARLACGRVRLFGGRFRFRYGRLLRRVCLHHPALLVTGRLRRERRRQRERQQRQDQCAPQRRPSRAYHALPARKELHWCGKPRAQSADMPITWKPPST